MTEPTRTTSESGPEPVASTELGPTEVGAGVGDRALLRVVVGGLIVAVLLRLLLAWTRFLQVDEIEHVHATFLTTLGQVPYRDFLQGHTPAIYLFLRPLVVADDPGLTYILSRTLMSALSLGTAYLVFAIGRTVFSPRAGQWGAVLLLLHTTFAERGMEVRPDGWVAFFTLLALYLEVRPGRHRLRQSGLAGASLAMAVLFSQKAAFMCVAIGLLWLARAVRQRRPMLVVAPMGAFLVPLAGSVAIFAAAGALDSFLYNVVLRPVEMFLEGSGSASTASFAPWRFLGQEAVRNLVFSTAAVVGAALAIRDRATSRAADVPWRAGPVLLFAGFCTLYLLKNPFPFPYLHVAVLPAYAVLAGVAIDRLLAFTAARGARPTLLVGGAVLAAALAQFLPRVLDRAGRTMDYQVALMEEVARITEPDDRVFDGVGLYFRPSAAFSYFFTTPVARAYASGMHPRLIPQWREHPPMVTMLNYRTSGLLPERERQFLARRFVHYRGNLFVHGFAIHGMQAGQSRTIDVLADKRFRYTGPPGTIEIDGEPFDAGVLTKGEHRVQALGPTQGGAILLDPPGQRFHEEPPVEDLYINFH